MEGGDGAAFADLPFVTVVADKTEADLVWSVPKGTVKHVVGGVVAEKVDTASINRSACSETATELAPPLLQIGTPARRAASMSALL